MKGTITDINGASRDVISEWKLARVEETHGDYIEYVYETTDEDVRGGLQAKAIYLKEVRAGNAGQEPHTVVVFEGNKVKQLKSNNARYGFLTSSNRLLEKITVNFLGEELRSYAFTYKDGAFFKEATALYHSNAAARHGISMTMGWMPDLSIHYKLSVHSVTVQQHWAEQPVLLLEARFMSVSDQMTKVLLQVLQPAVHSTTAMINQKDFPHL